MKQKTPNHYKPDEIKESLQNIGFYTLEVQKQNKL